MELPALIATYGYPVVFAGALIEGETVLALAGVAAHLGYLSLLKVVAVAAFGGFLGDQFYFFLGRRYGRAILERFPAAKAVAPRVDALVVKHRLLVVPLLRFAYGVRTAGPIVVGASGMNALEFAALNAIGAVAWAILVAGAGYLFGQAVLTLLGKARVAEEALFVAAAVATLIALVVYRQRRRRDSRRSDKQARA
ncbi:MAG TPA: DedA family protein [Burkholderiales bacterium]|nr:DedA family protein [Burkholderiales bacterium]